MIKAVKKAIDILRLLSDDPEKAMTVSEIATSVNITKPTCSHLLETLCESLFVERVSRKEGYRLGAGTFMLTRYGRYQESLIQLASPIIQWLRKQTEATSLLAVVCDGTKYIIFNAEGDNNSLMNDGDIRQGNIAVTATGKLMMAFMDPDSLNRVLYRLEADSPRSQLTKMQMEEFELIRKRGYAHVLDDTNDHIHSYAFRVHDGTKTVAAVGLFYPIYRDNEELRAKVIKSGLAAATEISRRLMFTAQSDLER